MIFYYCNIRYSNQQFACKLYFFLNFRSSVDIYQIFKELATSICLSLFLDIDDSEDYELYKSVSTTHWHGAQVIDVCTMHIHKRHKDKYLVNQQNKTVMNLILVKKSILTLSYNCQDYTTVSNSIKNFQFDFLSLSLLGLISVPMSVKMVGWSTSYSKASEAKVCIFL